MAECTGDNIITWEKEDDNHKGTWTSPENAKEGGRAAIKRKVELEHKCAGLECEVGADCRPRYFDEEADALIHTYTVPLDDGSTRHGYIIKKGSKLNVTCKCF